MIEMNQAKANISFQQKMLNPFFFKLFLFLKLPMAFLAGIKLKELSDNRAVFQMKYKYLNKNPFGSIYFACLSMAGELASGILAASIAYKSNPKLSMLVVGVKINFTKKAIGTILFECNQGKEILAAIQKSIITGEGQTIDVLTVAKNEQSDVVAEFLIQWSFKVKD
jgi:hypothetical protein